MVYIGVDLGGTNIAAGIVDENGMAVIMKNNKPRYVVVDFSEYDSISAAMQMRREKIDSVADKIIDENIEAFSELAK